MRKKYRHAYGVGGAVVGGVGAGVTGWKYFYFLFNIDNELKKLKLKCFNLKNIFEFVLF